jgi:uncharacterized protein (TIGR02996 family)
MSDRDALLATILADPADDTARLVFADWLSENGEADRGEFIRVEVELARTKPHTEDDERRRRVLLHRRDDLLRQHRAEWLAPFLPFAKDSSFERGFVSSLHVPAHAFLEGAERWFAVTPLTRVKFANGFIIGEDAGRLMTLPVFGSPWLDRLESIDLEGCQLTATDIEDLVSCAALPRLRELVLAWNDLRNEGATALAGMSQLKGLESLDLVGNDITDRGARAIAQSPYLGNLKELRITRNPIRNRTWKMLDLRFGPALVG